MSCITYPCIIPVALFLTTSLFHLTPLHEHPPIHHRRKRHVLWHKGTRFVFPSDAEECPGLCLLSVAPEWGMDHGRGSWTNQERLKSTLARGVCCPWMHTCLVRGSRVDHGPIRMRLKSDIPRTHAWVTGQPSTPVTCPRTNQVLVKSTIPYGRESWSNSSSFMGT